jgi:hypothetical protein
VSLGREGKQQVKFHRDRKPYAARLYGTESAKNVHTGSNCEPVKRRNPHYRV